MDSPAKHVANWEVKFGKHKGKKYKNLPIVYIQWCLKNDVINNEDVQNYCSRRYFKYCLRNEIIKE